MWYEIAPDVSEGFCNELEEAGYDAEMVLLEGSDHKDLMDASSEAFAAAVQTTLEVVESS